MGSISIFVVIPLERKNKTFYLVIFRYDEKAGFSLKFGKLFELLKKQMNFTYKAIPSKDGGYGSLVNFYDFFFFLSSKSIPHF